MAEQPDTVFARLGSLEATVRAAVDGVCRVERALEKHGEEMRGLHRETLDRVTRLEEQRKADRDVVEALDDRVSAGEELADSTRTALTILRWTAGIIGTVVAGLVVYVVKLGLGR